MIPLDVPPVKVALKAMMERIIAEVSTLRRSDELTLRRQRYTLRPNFNLRYSVDVSVSTFELEEVEEDVWDRQDVEFFVTNRVEASPEYANVLRLIQNEKHSFVRAFIHAVADDAATLSVSRMERHFNTILRDLADAPQDYIIKLWLTGITLAEDAVRISDTLVFRRPTRADLQEKIRTEALPYAHAFQNQVWFSCIAEFRATVDRPVEHQRQVDQLITALRLFRLGAVSVPRYDAKVDSFSPFANTQHGSPARAARIEYVLSPADAETLRRLLGLLMPLLPSSYGIPKNPDFLSTALHWYGEALLAGVPVEGTVAWAIACLEALFLGDNPSTEISYRLTHRVIALLRCFGWAPLEMRKTLTTAYDVRSKYVHGAVSKKHSPEQLSTLFRRVADYARASCLIWAQLRTSQKHDAVLKKLEEALIDDEARAQLQVWCDQIDFPQKVARADPDGPFMTGHSG